MYDHSAEAAAGPALRLGRRARPQPYRDAGKRLLDILLVLAAAPFVLPLVGLLWALARADGGPGFHRQRRVGRDGRMFEFWKLRTMVPDAERRLPRILAENPEAAREWALRQKLARDPRVTRLGDLMRRTSLDELPQLWNVLRGDMSLVGPRPFLPGQRPLYDAGAPDAAYYRMRPGLTGPWQVNRRSAGSFAERLAYDEEYWRQMTLAGDLRLLLRTFAVVARATGR